jgi:hypothetical protein
MVPSTFRVAALFPVWVSPAYAARRARASRPNVLARAGAPKRDRVDYYGVEGQSRSFVRADRARTIQRYPRREITIEGQATMFEEPDLARVLVTKSWTFVGSGERWTGRMRQELRMRNIDGTWLIVSEKSNRVYDQDRQRI